MEITSRNGSEKCFRISHLSHFPYLFCTLNGRSAKALGASYFTEISVWPLPDIGCNQVFAQCSVSHSRDFFCQQGKFKKMFYSLKNKLIFPFLFCTILSHTFDSSIKSSALFITFGQLHQKPWLEKDINRKNSISCQKQLMNKSRNLALRQCTVTY
jgi:hypothetical protein